MPTANIIKKAYLFSELQKLSVNEQKRLASALMGFGNLKKTVRETKLAEQTLKRASVGMRVNPDTAAKIRKFLKRQPVKA